MWPERPGGPEGKTLGKTRFAQGFYILFANACADFMDTDPAGKC